MYKILRNTVLVPWHFVGDSQFTGTAEKMKKDLLLACYYRMKSSISAPVQWSTQFELMLNDFGNFGSGSQV